MDQSYAGLLEKGLAQQTVVLQPEEAEDLLTRTILQRTQYAALSTVLDPNRAAENDAVLLKLAELRLRRGSSKV